MQRRSTAAMWLLVVAMLLFACSRNSPPNSLFDSAGYHVKDGKVYFLNAFPGKAFEMSDADAASFKALDSTYDGADPQSFRVLNADFECSTDGARAYYRQSVIASADPRNFPPGRAVTNCSETSISFAQ